MSHTPAPPPGILDLFQGITRLHAELLDQAQRLLSHPSLPRLIADREHYLRERDVDLGFNVFELISDRYHRENFHSDLLHALLNPQSPHGDGAKYLVAFLEFLNARTTGKPISVDDYKTGAEVTKETGNLATGRIDILIRSKPDRAGHRKAIIIENKINGAADQPNQLSRYLWHATKDLHCECQAIVYLCLNRKRQPDVTGWTENDKQNVHKRLIVINACDETSSGSLPTEETLKAGWLDIISQTAAHEDTRSILRQYSQLLTKLSGNVMNKVLMQQFYQLMTEPGQFKNALAFQSMFQDLVEYRTERLVSFFEKELSPFSKVFMWNANVAVAERYLPFHFKIDTAVTADRYTVYLADYHFNRAGTDKVKDLLQTMERLDQFVPDGNRYRLNRSFAFPEEEDALLQYLSAFKAQLAPLLSGSPESGAPQA